MEQAQKTRQPRKDTAATAEAKDLRDQELDADVECCLADIDAALEEAAAAEEEVTAERDRQKAAAEADFWAEYSHRGQEEAWKQKYAHLNAQVAWCCGTPEPYFNE
jgi:hypothetical protein